MSDDRAPEDGEKFGACEHVTDYANWIEIDDAVEMGEYVVKWIGLCDDCAEAIRPLGNGTDALHALFKLCDRVMWLAPKDQLN